MQTLPPLVIVMATHGRTSLLERTFQSLRDAALPKTYAGLHLLENGGASAETREIVARDRGALQIRHRTFPDRNRALAMNALLSDLDDEVIVFLDDDVRIAPGTLTAYAGAAEAHPEGAFFGGPLDVDYEAPPPEWLRRYLPRSAAGWEWTGPGPVVREALFLGGNWAARARDLKALGGFNARFGPGARTNATGQETMMQRVLLAHGFHGIYVPDARVWHYVPRQNCTPRWALRRAYRNGVSEGLRIDRVEGQRLLGMPRWMVKQIAKKAARTAARQLKRRPEERFQAAFDLMWSVGRLQGLKAADRTRVDS